MKTIQQFLDAVQEVNDKANHYRDCPTVYLSTPLGDFTLKIDKAHGRAANASKAQKCAVLIAFLNEHGISSVAHYGGESAMTPQNFARCLRAFEKGGE